MQNKINARHSKKTRYFSWFPVCLWLLQPKQLKLYDDGEQIPVVWFSKSYWSTTVCPLGSDVTSSVLYSDPRCWGFIPMDTFLESMLMWEAGVCEEVRSTESSLLFLFSQVCWPLRFLCVTDLHDKGPYRLLYHTTKWNKLLRWFNLGNLSFDRPRVWLALPSACQSIKSVKYKL